MGEAATSEADAPLLRMRGIGKRYGGVTALDDVEFACRSGSIHAVLGENGAGKSTLIKIIAGVVQPSAGEMFLQERAVRFATPAEATREGIVSIFQELSLLPDLTVADNISITDPPRRFGLIDGAAQRRRVAARPHRLLRRSSDGSGQEPDPVAPPDGRDRQGARPQSQAAHPRRGDL